MLRKACYEGEERKCVEAAGSTSLKADLPGDLDSEPSSSSFTPVPDLKAIGAVCYISGVGK